MKQALLLCTLLAALAALSGCYKTNFIHGDRPITAPLSVSQSFYLFGLIGPDMPTRADRLCPAGVARIQTQASFVDSLISFVTLGIYSPRTVQVFCAAGRTHNFYLDDQDRLIGHEIVGADGQRELVDINTQVY